MKANENDDACPALVTSASVAPWPHLEALEWPAHIAKPTEPLLRHKRWPHGDPVGLARMPLSCLLLEASWRSQLAMTVGSSVSSLQFRAGLVAGSVAAPAVT